MPSEAVISFVEPEPAEEGSVFVEMVLAEATISFAELASAEETSVFAELVLAEAGISIQMLALDEVRIFVEMLVLARSEELLVAHDGELRGVEGVELRDVECEKRLVDGGEDKGDQRLDEDGVPHVVVGARTPQTLPRYCVGPDHRAVVGPSRGGDL